MAAWEWVILPAEVVVDTECARHPNHLGHIPIVDVLVELPGVVKRENEIVDFGRVPIVEGLVEDLERRRVITSSEGVLPQMQSRGNGQ